MNSPSYYSLLFIILGSYLFPFIALSVYGQSVASPQGSWRIFSLGLLLASMGSLFLFFTIRRWAGVDFQKSTPEGPSEKDHFTESLQPSMEKVFQFSQKQNTEDMGAALKKYIDMASKITGAHSFGAQAKRQPAKYKALEQRRLFENLRTEQEHIVLVYSPKEHKFLFVNPQVSSFLGWEPEKFSRQFSELITEGSREWNDALIATDKSKPSSFKMILKAKNGVVVPFKCLLGNIPEGLLSQHLLAVLSAEK